MREYEMLIATAQSIRETAWRVRALQHGDLAKRIEELANAITVRAAEVAENEENEESEARR